MLANKVHQLQHIHSIVTAAAVTVCGQVCASAHLRCGLLELLPLSGAPSRTHVNCFARTLSGPIELHANYLGLGFSVNHFTTRFPCA